MITKLFLVLLLVVGAVLARPKPQDTGGASERGSLNEDEEEQKICISFKRISIPEVTQVKGELPIQLTLKLSENSRPRLVHYKVLTVDGSGEESYPDVKMVTRAKVIPIDDSMQDRVQGNGTISAIELPKVLPYRESTLNGSAERNVAQKGTEKSGTGNNTGGSVYNNGTEDAFKTGSQTAGEIVELGRTSYVSTVTEELTTSESNMTDIGTTKTRFTTTGSLSRAGDNATETTDDTSELQRATSEPKFLNGTEFAETTGDGGIVTVPRKHAEDDFKPLDTSTSNKTQDEWEDGKTVTTNEDLERMSTADDVVTTTRAWINHYMQGQREYSTDTVRLPKKDLFSEPEVIDSPLGANETGIDERNEPRVISDNETNNTFTTEMTPTGSQIDKEAIKGILEYEQGPLHQNGIGNSTLIESNEEQKGEDGFRRQETTVFYGGTSESTEVTTISNTTVRTSDDGGSSSEYSVDQVDTSTATPSSSLATYNQGTNVNSPVSENQDSTTPKADLIPENIRKEFRYLPNEGENDSLPTPRLPSEVVTHKLVNANISSERVDESNITSTILPSGDAEAETTDAPENGGVEENAFDESTTSTKPSPEIVTSISGELLDVLSVEDSTEPYEIVTSKSGEVLNVLSIEDQNHSVAGSTASFDKNESKITDGFHDKPIEEKGMTLMNGMTTPEPTTVTDGLVVHHRILSNDEQAAHVTNTQLETTQSVLSSTTAPMSSAIVVGSDPAQTSSVHHGPSKEPLSDTPPASAVTYTTPAGDFRGLSVSGYEDRTSRVPEVTTSLTRSTTEEVEKVEIVTLQPAVDKNIPIFSFQTETPPGVEGVTNGSPLGPPQRQQEDWEKFNNFTIILPTRQSYFPDKYPVMTNYYQPGSLIYKMYDRARGQMQIVHLPMARQI